MSRTRIIEYIGASDEDIAHVRLLLRAAAIHLDERWRWGTEDKADLVLVDARSLIGDSARRRTLERGVACASVVEADAPAPEGRFLRKPLRREDFVALLNGVGGSTVAPLPIVTQGDDFFDLDLGEPDFSDVAAFDLGQAQAQALQRERIQREHEAFHELLRRDPLADAPQFLMPERLGDDVGVEFIRGPTARSAARAEAVAHPAAGSGGDETFIDPTFRRDAASGEDEDATHPLSDYLRPGLLGGPARIALPGVQPLVLDPKEQVFHALGRLPALEPYCRQPLRLGDWQRLVNYQLDVIRLNTSARPYSRLVWMDRYVRSNGYLARHLDPGGTYRLTRWIELANDYPRAFRAAAAMMHPLKLHEIARAADVSLAEVFDVVNAYEAIGYVEWTPRERFQRPNP